VELFRVTLEYADRLSNEEIPPRKTVLYYSAVFGAFGSSMVTRAGNIAIRAVIGAQSHSWEPVVKHVEYVGSVVVETTPAAAARGERTEGGE